ncbi:sodium-dependent phosphate transport protein 2B [Patella vulgata]|uniref:sodium-dependent phosphate transport protein 2B n=1 Tax=Patella vulgata TaxID=6465 RepID=UPI00218066C4|nr:sodium-dependent phosphate transport protein 2B [Patella vulgata]
MEILPTHRPRNKVETMSILKRLSIIVGVLVLSFLFMTSLIYFTSSTVLLGENSTDYILLWRPDILCNPITTLMVGILASSILQNQQVTLFIIITMVTDNIIHLSAAIPLIMGMNIGSSLTPALTAMFLVNKRCRFSQAVCSVLLSHLVHWFTTIILLPLELATGFLVHVSAWIFYEDFPVIATYQQYGLLQGVLKPITGYILQLQLNDTTYDTYETVSLNRTIQCRGILCESGLSTVTIGLLLMITSLIGCIVFTILTSKLVSRKDNSTYSMSTNVPKDYCSYLKGLGLVAVGCAVTMLVQDNILIQCAALPIIGAGFLNTEKVYPLIVGSNTGAAVSILLQAMSDPMTSAAGLRILSSHLMFNICGLVLFYCIPYSSRIPIHFAESLSEKIREYRWVMVAVITLAFFLLPLAIFGFALAGPHYVIIFISFLLFMVLVITTISLMQNFCPDYLTPAMRSWEFLPPFLEPYNRCAKNIANRAGSIRCTRSSQSFSPDQSNIRASRCSVIPKDVQVSVPTKSSCCCCPWLVSSFTTKYSLSVPPQTSTPKVPEFPKRTPLLLSFKPDSARELLECSYSKYDPKEALNFGTLGFEDETFSSDSDDSSEDPTDYTRSSSTSSYASISDDDEQLLLFNAF